MKEVRIDEATSTALVIVPDYQLSLAIGKEGQNARLAARLTGWRIDIKSEAQVADESRPAPAALRPRRRPPWSAVAGARRPSAEPAAAGRGARLERGTRSSAAVTDARLAPAEDTAVAEHRRGARGSVSRWRAPERTCVGCRGKAPKCDAAPVVARPRRGRVAVDPSGSAPGRGAYVHRDRACVEAALRSGAFARALRTGLTADAAARLGNDLERRIGAV